MSRKISTVVFFFALYVLIAWSLTAVYNLALSANSKYAYYAASDSDFMNKFIEPYENASLGVIRAMNLFLNATGDIRKPLFNKVTLTSSKRAVVVFCFGVVFGHFWPLTSVANRGTLLWKCLAYRSILYVAYSESDKMSFNYTRIKQYFEYKLSSIQNVLVFVFLLTVTFER